MSEADRVSEAAAASQAIPPEFMQGGGAPSLTDAIKTQAVDILSSNSTKGQLDKPSIQGQLDLLAQSVPDDSLKTSISQLIDAVSSVESISDASEFVSASFSAGQSHGAVAQTPFDGVNVSISTDAAESTSAT